MKTTLSITLLFMLALSGCAGQSQNYKLSKLPSGKEIKITGMTKMDFPNSDPALVLNYLTDISIDDKVALRKRSR